jgi:hypothetical protein
MMAEGQSWDEIVAEAEANAIFAQSMHDQCKANLDAAEKVLAIVKRRHREMWIGFALTSLELVAMIVILAVHG